MGSWRLEVGHADAAEQIGNLGMYDDGVGEQVRRVVPEAARFPERRLLAEYLALKFPDRVVFHGQPLGPAVAEVPFAPRRELSLRASRPWRPEVDAVVVWAPADQVRFGRHGRAGWLQEVPAGTVVLLIEAKVAQLIDGIAKLPLYRALVPSTPELEAAAGAEVRMRLVAPAVGEWVRVAAEAVGVEIDVYRPAWIEGYYAYREGYWSRDHRIAREQVLRARQRLGL